MSQVITLKRAYLPKVTLSTLRMPSGFKCYTVERPWLQNQPFLSCIPEGTYLLKKRVSGVVQRSTRNEFREGWEVTGVSNRTFIMFHPANLPTELEGCIAPGMSIGVVKGQPAVTESLIAFRKLMAEMDSHDEWTLHITTQRAEYTHD